MWKPLPQDTLQTNAYPLAGGTDFITPQLTINAGSVIDGENFEIPSEGGYRRVWGFERFNGMTAPSVASATVMFPGGGPTFSVTQANVGNTVTGVTSGATGTVAYVDPGAGVLPTGIPGYQSTTGNTYIVLTATTGAFTVGETLKIGASTIGTYLGTQPYSWSGFNDNVAAAAAANIYRALISPVPGVGAILGVWVYNSTIYAFRGNPYGTPVGALAGTQTLMWKSTSSGWVQVASTIYVSYTGGNTALGTLQTTTEAGGTGTLTQGAVTATVARVTLASGSFTGGTATGIMVIRSPSGTFAAGAATATGGAAMTLSGAQTSLKLNPGGTYQFQNYAFAGSTNSYRMYGCDGKNNAFEFDGTNYVPIITGMSVDAPQFLHVHQHYLFLVFNASVQFSVVANPFGWSLILGAGEIDLGANCTSLVRGIGNEVTGGLILFTKDITYALYGTSPSTWNLVPVCPEAGGASYSVQNVQSPVFLDKLGITILTQTIAYGNYEQAIISEKIKKFVKQRLSNTTCSVVVRGDNQYRLFFSDGTGVILTFRGGEVEGSMIWVCPNVFNCACETTDLGGAVFVGDASTGYVYQLNSGTSFDGVAINSYIRLAYNNCGSPLVEKHFFRQTFDLLLNGPAVVQVGFNLSMNIGDSDSSMVQSVGQVGGAAQWDSSNWDSFYWDGDAYMRTTVPLDCDGTDVSIMVSSVTDNVQPFTLQAGILEYSMRRQRRAHY